jgi:hypothetical protein
LFSASVIFYYCSLSPPGGLDRGQSA